MLTCKNTKAILRPMDWKNTIIEIQAATGMSQAAVGMAVGRSQAWIADILSGRYDDVKWRDGESLRRLHSAHCQAGGAAETCQEHHQEAA